MPRFAQTPRPPLRKSALALSATAALGIALTGLVAAPADAATSNLTVYDSGQMYYQAGAENNDVTVTQAGVSSFTITDTGATISTSSPSCIGDGTTVVCSGVTLTSMQLELGDGDDDAVTDIAGSTYVNGGSGNNTLTNMQGTAQFNAGAGDDTLKGGPNQDYMQPGGGVNTVIGGDGPDYYAGADGSDTVDLGAGDDVLYASSGTDDLHGGTGTDLLSYNYYFGAFLGAVTVSLDDVANDGGTGAGVENAHSDIENITTTNGNDTITATDGRNIIDSGAGDDTVHAMGGKDVVQGSAGTDTLMGGDGDDRLDGGVGDDNVFGNGGDDYLEGADSGGDDVYSGGTGVDYVGIFRTVDVMVTLDNVANDGEAGEADNVKSDVENVETGVGDDTIIGSRRPNDLSGGDGNDTIRGGAGYDGINGGLGRDILGGGPGIDSISGGGSVDTITTADRFADYVICGSSIDSVNRDHKDQVAVDCETLS